MKLVRSKGECCVSRAVAFTLPEVVLATFLGVVMFTALFASFASGYALTEIAREDLRATQILLTRLERVRLCAWESVTNATINPPTFEEYYDPTDAFSAGGGVVYKGTFTATMPQGPIIPDAYRTNMLLVTVGVSWTNSSKVVNQRSMRTYVARYGMQSYVLKGQ